MTENNSFGEIIYREAREEPFDIYGLYEVHSYPYYCRIPKEVSDGCNNGVKGLYRNTAGGRIRFRTDSKAVAYKVVTGNPYTARHFPDTGSGGIDIYVFDGLRYVFAGASETVYRNNAYEGIFDFGTSVPREIMIHMPIYNNVEEFLIGLEKDSSVSHGKKYAYEKPFVTYGSSITQGGCASRPGNTYQSMISLMTDHDFVNLGFSGSARGESVMAEHIAGLDMSCFVLDYDYNAPSEEHLLDTHEKFFLTVREKNPDLPIVIVTIPDFYSPQYKNVFPESNDRRRNIIYTTYENALKRGDKNVSFVDGSVFFRGSAPDACTVDGCHPNDLGFYYMAMTLKDYVK